MIIVIKEKDRVVVGFANSEWNYPYPDEDAMEAENIPVKHLCGAQERLLGFTKASFLADLFMYDGELLVEPTTADEMKRDIAPMVQRAAKQFKRIDEDDGWQNAMIVVEGDRIFDVNTTFQVREIVNYVCHGYNIELVESVLDATAGEPAEERIRKAISYHAKMVGLAVPMIALFDTKSLDCRFLKGV